MNALFQHGVGNEELLFVSAIALACVLTFLAVRRVFTSLRARHKPGPRHHVVLFPAFADLADAAAAPALGLLDPQVASPPAPGSPAIPPPLDPPVSIALPRPALALARVTPQPLQPASATEPVALPVRRRPKPAREAVDSVLSPETLLAHAHEHLAAGAHEQAATQLRLCARLASKLKQPLIEASARLELGDLARASGDLTTACEHWQIARSLFADIARPADALAVEKRMEQASCPTDWVLTQF